MQDTWSKVFWALLLVISIAWGGWVMMRDSSPVDPVELDQAHSACPFTTAWSG